MADYGGAISMERDLSHTSDDSSSEHSPRSVPILPTATPATPQHGSSSRFGGPTHSDDHHHQRSQSTVEITQRKPRGRPPGSKNKPKQPIIITKDSDSAMKPAVLEISVGSDIIETIINFARKNHAGISVISASGSVSNVTLRHPLSPAPSLSLHGPFSLLALSGSFIGSLGAKPSSSSGFGTGSSCFGISLAAAQGQVFGGIVAGKVIAASTVMVVAATFLNPAFHRLPSDNDAEDTKPSLAGGSANESATGVSTGMSMSAYGVASPSPISQISPPEIMHWAPPSRSPY